MMSNWKNVLWKEECLTCQSGPSHTRMTAKCAKMVRTRCATFCQTWTRGSSGKPKRLNCRCQNWTEWPGKLSENKVTCLCTCCALCRICHVVEKFVRDIRTQPQTEETHEKNAAVLERSFWQDVDAALLDLHRDNHTELTLTRKPSFSGWTPLFQCTRNKHKWNVQIVSTEPCAEEKPWVITTLSPVVVGRWVGGVATNRKFQIGGHTSDYLYLVHHGGAPLSGGIVVISQTISWVSRVRLARWCESLALLSTQCCHLASGGSKFAAGVSHHTPPSPGGAGLIGLCNQF